MYVNFFCDAGQVPILGYFEACKGHDLETNKKGILSS